MCNGYLAYMYVCATWGNACFPGMSEETYQIPGAVNGCEPQIPETGVKDGSEPPRMYACYAQMTKEAIRSLAIATTDARNS